MLNIYNMSPFYHIDSSYNTPAQASPAATNTISGLVTLHAASSSPAASSSSQLTRRMIRRIRPEEATFRAAVKQQQWDIVKTSLAFCDVKNFNMNILLTLEHEHTTEKLGNHTPIWHAAKTKQWEIIALMLQHKNDPRLNHLEFLHGTIETKLEMIDLVATIQKWETINNPINDILKTEEIEQSLLLLLAAKWSGKILISLLNKIIEELNAAKDDQDAYKKICERMPNFNKVMRFALKEDKRKNALWYAIHYGQWKFAVNLIQNRTYKASRGLNEDELKEYNIRIYGKEPFDPEKFIEGPPAYKVELIRRWAIVHGWDQSPIPIIRIRSPLTLIPVKPSSLPKKNEVLPGLQYDAFDSSNSL